MAIALYSDEAPHAKLIPGVQKLSWEGEISLHMTEEVWQQELGQLRLTLQNDILLESYDVTQLGAGVYLGKPSQESTDETWTIDVLTQVRPFNQVRWYKLACESTLGFLPTQ